MLDSISLLGWCTLALAIIAAVLLAACTPGQSSQGLNTRFEAELPISGTIRFAE